MSMISFLSLIHYREQVEREKKAATEKEHLLTKKLKFNEFFDLYSSATQKQGSSVASSRGSSATSKSGSGYWKAVSREMLLGTQRKQSLIGKGNLGPIEDLEAVSTDLLLEVEEGNTERRKQSTGSRRGSDLKTAVSKAN